MYTYPTNEFTRRDQGLLGHRSLKSREQTWMISKLRLLHLQDPMTITTLILTTSMALGRSPTRTRRSCTKVFFMWSITISPRRSRSIHQSPQRMAATAFGGAANAKNFYASRFGRKLRICSTWDACKSYTDGFKGAKFKNFLTLDAAASFVGGKTDESKFRN